MCHAFLRSNHIAMAMLVACMLAGGCAPSSMSNSQSSDISQAAPAGLQVLRIPTTEEPTQFSVRFGGNIQFTGALVNAFLALTDEVAATRPMLLERLPSQDDGSWIVNSNGTMRTTLMLRPDLRWSDGQPLTAHDIAFAYEVYSDRSLPLPIRVPESYITSIRVIDERTAEVSWNLPYFNAGSPAARDLAPLPRHLLEDLYRRDKEAFLNSSFWTGTEYVGNGPYSVTGREPGVQITLTANPFFVFGKPHIPSVEIRVIPNTTVVVAGMLAGDLDFAESQNIRVEEVGALRDQWQGGREGRIYTSFFRSNDLEFQYRDVPRHQPAVRDLRVRRALMHAIDREALAGALSLGLSRAADSMYSPQSALWPRIDQATVKYGYDLRLATNLLTEAGWTKDGEMLKDAIGTPFEIEITSGSNPNISVITADYWRVVGISGKPIPMPPALRDDGEYRANFAGVLATVATPPRYINWTSDQIPTPQNQFRGRNYGGYQNAEVDTLARRLETSLSAAERDDATVAIERALGQDMAAGWLYYEVSPAAGRSRVTGVKGKSLGDSATYVFNIWEWKLE